MNKHCRLLFYTFFLFLSVRTAFAQSKQASKLPTGLDNYINEVLKTFEVPGVSVVIVQNGEVLLAKGYGVKKLGVSNSVDAHTLFSIASNSKAFTATALAILVEEGKLKWDDPVIDHLPWFRMSDWYVTTHLTVKDLLVHYSGLPAYVGDLMLFPPSAYSRKEIISKLKLIPLTHNFRSVYAYDNVLYLVAGEIIAAVSGSSWEDFVKTRIFNKLGMSESLSRFSDVKNAVNVSSSHKRLNGKIQPEDNFANLNIGDSGDPVGGIMTNASDMAKWLITQLDSGRTPDHRGKIFTPSTTNQLWKIVTPMPIAKQPAELKPAQMDFYGYALGFRAYNYNKYKVVGHGGKLGGFVSQIAMVPTLNLGISVFTNQESTEAYWSIIYHIMDYYMQNKPFNWIAGYKKQFDNNLQNLLKEQNKSIIKPDTNAKASLPLEKYAGNYNDSVYGDASITKESSGIVLQFKQLPHLTADLTYFQYNTFIARFRNKALKADAYVTFSLNPDGCITQIKLKIIDPDSDLDFDDILLKPVAKKQ